MGLVVSNNAVSKLTGAITTSSTSFTITGGTGLLFPSTATGDTFNLSIVDSSNNIEIVTCTNRNTDIFTVTRAQEGTTARAFSVGDRVALTITAAAFNAKADKTTIDSHIADATDAHAASAITFTDTISLAATTVQAAIVALFNKITLRAFAGANTDITSLNSPNIQSATCATQAQYDASTKVANTLYVDRAANNKNFIINGCFEVAQEGTSQALTASPYTASMDMWAFSQNGVANGVAALVASGLPSIYYCLKLGRNAGATTTGNIIAITALDNIDSVSLQGKLVTLSFWAKAGANFSAANLGVTLYTGTGTDQSAASIGTWTGVLKPIDTTQVLTTGWVRYSLPAVTLSATLLQFGLAFTYTPTNTIGNVGSAGADDNVYITDVRLNEGSVASSERRSYIEELRLCQKYFEPISVQIFNGNVVTGGTYYLNTRFMVTKRVSPAIVIVELSNFGFAASGLVADVVNNDSFRVTKICNSSQSAGFFVFSAKATARL